MLRNTLIVAFVVGLGSCGGRTDPVYVDRDGGKDSSDAIEAKEAGGGGGAGAGGSVGSDSGSSDSPVDVPMDLSPDAGPDLVDGKTTSDTGGGCTPLDTAASCGPTCATCTAPTGGTPTCASGTCDFTCGSMKKCAAAKLCIATTGCCDDSDCPTQNGKVGTCDTGTHSCSYACAANMKACNGACIPTDACCVDKDCPGTCQKCSSSHACAPATNTDDPTARCSGTCDASGKCKSKQGQHCTSPTADGCLGGVSCVDTYCCNTSCTGSCMACDVAGAEGTCTAVASGAPHGGRAQCAGAGSTCAGSCGGRQDGACVYPSGKCGTAMCSGTDKVIGQGTCSSGVCMPPNAATCADNYACASGTCKTTCSTNADCQVGFACSNGQCYRALKVVGGVHHSCVLLSDGTSRCWGGPFSAPGTFIQVGGLADAIDIASGNEHACAVVKSGAVKCWGAQEGTGIPGVITTAQTVTGVTGATSIAAGANRTCAVVAGGALKCWGPGGPPGDGSEDGSFTPVTVAGLTSVTSVAVGGRHICAVSAGGIWCWGQNMLGQLSSLDPLVGTENYRRLVPFQTGLQGTVVAVGSAGSSTDSTFSCAIVSGGNVKCWGEYLAGNGFSHVPVAVPGISGAMSITAGYKHVCAASAADVKCWGQNDQGVLGFGPGGGEVISSPSTAVTALAAVSSLSSGFNHVCATVADGTGRCWGSNGTGQLGISNLTPASFAPIVLSGW